MATAAKIVRFLVFFGAIGLTVLVWYSDTFIRVGNFHPPDMKTRESLMKTETALVTAREEKPTPRHWGSDTTQSHLQGNISMSNKFPITSPRSLDRRDLASEIKLNTLKTKTESVKTENMHEAHRSVSPDMEAALEKRSKSWINSTGLFIMTGVFGRTGNRMFEYASMYGIAKRNNMTPVLLANAEVRRVFQIPDYIPHSLPPGVKLVKFHEKKYAFYDNRTETLCKKGQSVQLLYYLQSWKYFHNVEDDLKQHFRFRKEAEFRREIKAFFDNALLELGMNNKREEVTYIGIHARNWKDLRTNTLERGYNVAPSSYYTKAMRYFENIYKNILFIVLSDDMSWCKENIQHPRIRYNPFNDPILSLALLGSCNHTIISVGTFSWWGAWLAGGDVVYYKDWPKPGTHLWWRTNHEDYFPPKWIGMSG
ncbi:galactoside 2-alpha-L-fucosyltransferase 2-like [Lingula anatina]|uniref:L-Fucosyltransferase n=1 Tax=Lingula anatina TaxID=7574 RepID=A0A1S3K6Q4_LINAN|nr:galactoside 2-alpha-L-fucosyltransferase 2-like [Lingula anatina]|eukprot:XP_013418109.1 galactoside 2-alpha-L-fucosyltransferase 2-like [Lingula anatina]